MTPRMFIASLTLAVAAAAASSATAQEVTAEVRTWSGQALQLSQPSLEVFYTIVPKEEGPGGQQLPGAATYIHDAAERIDHAASDLRNRNLSDIAGSVRRLGQERPLALFGGAVLAGFVLTRFLKSGQSDRDGDSGPNSERT